MSFEQTTLEGVVKKGKEEELINSNSERQGHTGGGEATASEGGEGWAVNIMFETT